MELVPSVASCFQRTELSQGRRLQARGQGWTVVTVWNHWLLLQFQAHETVPDADEESLASQHPPQGLPEFP